MNVKPLFFQNAQYGSRQAKEIRIAFYYFGSPLTFLLKGYTKMTFEQFLGNKVLNIIEINTVKQNFYGLNNYFPIFIQTIVKRSIKKEEFPDNSILKCSNFCLDFT